MCLPCACYLNGSPLLLRLPTMPADPDSPTANKYRPMWYPAASKGEKPDDFDHAHPSPLGHTCVRSHWHAHPPSTSACVMAHAGGVGMHAAFQLLGKLPRWAGRCPLWQPAALNGEAVADDSPHPTAATLAPPSVCVQLDG